MNGANCSRATERHLMNLMTRGTNKGATMAHLCWSCREEVARTDNFCRHCGMWSPLHRDESIHGRLLSIEKLLLKTIFGCGIASGWVDCATNVSFRHLLPLICAGLQKLRLIVFRFTRGPIEKCSYHLQELRSEVPAWRLGNTDRSA